MKMKKFMFTASSLAVATSLVGSVLTSCGKATVDEKLKMDLNDNGFLSNEKTQADYKMALTDALSRSSNWTQFKAALADEIVYRWYLDRAADNKDSSEKNNTFRVNLDEWTDKIKKDYDETIKNLKNKYGDKWEFYLQNETLAPMGGTEESYKHAKLVEKVRAEFLSKVFATNYFGLADKNEATGKRAKYQHIYRKAQMNVSEDLLNDPSIWSRLGFYARTNTSFAIDDSKPDDIDASFLAKNPDGDYAQIQSYVFDRWFKTEKPFFSAASLFKYSNPKYLEESKLTQVYNGASKGVKIPDNPNEAFPFFGGNKDESAKGTRAYAAWYAQLEENGFDTLYESSKETWTGNGTISIPKTMTEDSQTLLLCFGSQMIGGSANALYIPYANAAASLYMQMMALTQTEADNYKPGNTITQQKIYDKIKDLTDKKVVGLDNDAILSNFFYTGTKTSTEPALNTIKSYVDLGKIYGCKDTTNYHCPIFKENKEYTFLYGVEGSTDGVKYVTNTVQVELGKGTDGSWTDTQPWIFELNESGMHAQTIDGYRLVAKKSTTEEKTEQLKNVIKYRLMQKKCGHNEGIISGDVFGDSGKLKSYFSDNFTNIILELAFNTELGINVFRPIKSYTDDKVEQGKLFLNEILTNEKFGLEYSALLTYLKNTILYDDTKKFLDAYETANSKTYAYRTKQMENARTTEEHFTVFENGLLAPIAYAPTDSAEKGVCPKVYKTAEITKLGAEDAVTRVKLASIQKDIHTQIKALINTVPVNADLAFSPQISAAKTKSSNRFWYKSYLVDKMMYQYMSNKEGMTNYIKGDAMNKYTSGILTDKMANNDLYNAFKVTYAENKLFTSDRNYANFGAATDVGTGIFTALDAYLGDTDPTTEPAGEYAYKLTTNGQYCDEYLNLQTYKATLAYLIGKDKNFENFYKVLNTKISEDEMALVGYISKTNKNIFTDCFKATEDLTPEDFNTVPYYWTADVNNIFDTTGYAGGTQGTPKNAKIASDQYWKVINKLAGEKKKSIALAGFTGLQTKASNSIDSASKLQESVFDKFAKCTDNSRVLTGMTEEKEALVTAGFATKNGTTYRYVENYGCWFAYAGTKDLDGKTVLSFEEVTDGTDTIKPDDFKSGENWLPQLKLAKKIAENRSLDNLRTLAKNLGAAYYGDSTFRQIGDGTIKENDIKKLKVLMLKEIDPKFDNGKANLKCFQRMTDVETHEAGSDAAVPSTKKYAFSDDKGNTYRILMTQLNKADVTEKRFAPTWNATSNEWEGNKASPIQIQEFWYILSAMAMESNVQQMAISDVVKTVYGDDKLIVYDAELYNTFDSVWIKDWSKKTMGA